jgi:uncharacterized membrane protein YkoI
MKRSFDKMLKKIEILFHHIAKCSNQANTQSNDMETTTTTMTPAARGAALKREKMAAAKLARAAGKVAAAERRDAKETEWTEGLRKGREEIEKKVQAARKAMGVRKNDPNPSGIREMKEKWDFEMMFALRKQVLGE